MVVLFGGVGDDARGQIGHDITYHECEAFMVICQFYHIRDACIRLYPTTVSFKEM